MKTPVLALALALTAAAVAAQTTPAAPVAAAPTRLSGLVLDAAGHPLPGVNVFLKTTFDGATTDSLGRFTFRSTATGTLPLVTMLLGYELQETPLALPAAGGELVLPTCRLRESRASLGTVVITAGSFEASDDRRSAALKPLDIVTTAGALGDVAGALNTLPGTTRVGEEGKLFMRGGAASETRQYLDGLPVQNPYGGSVPATTPARGRFSPFLFKGTVFSTGGYSAEYGQALSAVVGLNSTDLAAETQTGISLLSVGGSLSRTRRWATTSLAVTADYTNLAPYYGLVPQRYGWEVAPQAAGGSVKLAHRTAHDGMFKVYGTFSQQRLTMRQPSPDAQFATDGQRIALLNTNAYLNTSYRTALRHGWSLNAGLALSRDQNELRPEPQALAETEQTAVARLVLYNDSASTRYNFKLGTELTAQRYDLRYLATPEATPLTPGFLEKRSTVFAESDLSLSRRLTGRVGVRGEYSALLGAANLAPRLALALATGANSQVSAAGGLFYQNPTNDLLRVSHDLRFEQATHYLLSYQRMAHDRTLRAELYYKDYQHLTRYSAAAPFDPRTFESTGTGYARGLDVFWRDRNRTLPNLDYWVSYGLLDTKRRYRADLAEAVPTFAATHNLSVVGKYWLGKLHTQAGFTYSYGSPRAYYDPNQPGYNQGRTPSFQDLSVNFSYLTHIAKQYTIVYVSASNVLGRNNIYGYRYAATPDAATGQYASVATQPAAPRMLFVGVFISINKKSSGDTSVAPE
ncbi:MAG: TonB-dependent receptor [Janthinobacterium lividum]